MPKPPDEFIAELLSERQPYHKERPTRILIIQGKLAKEQVQMWVKQLHYFRVHVPQKELYVLANCSIAEVRIELMKKYIEEEDDRVLAGRWGPMRSCGSSWGKASAYRERTWRTSGIFVQSISCLWTPGSTMPGITVGWRARH